MGDVVVGPDDLVCISFQAFPKIWYVFLPRREDLILDQFHRFVGIQALVFEVGQCPIGALLLVEDVLLQAALLLQSLGHVGSVLFQMVMNFPAEAVKRLHMTLPLSSLSREDRLEGWRRFPLRQMYLHSRLIDPLGVQPFGPYLRQPHADHRNLDALLHGGPKLAEAGPLRS